MGGQYRQGQRRNDHGFAKAVASATAIGNDDAVDLVGEEYPPDLSGASPPSLTFLEHKSDLLTSIQEYVELYDVQLDYESNEEDKEYDQDEDDEAHDLSYNYHDGDTTLFIGMSTAEQENDRLFLAHEVITFLRLSANNIGANANTDQQSSSFDMHLDDIETAAWGDGSSSINAVQSFAVLPYGEDNERATSKEGEDFIAPPTKQYRFLQHVLSEEEFIEMDDLAAEARANEIVNKMKAAFQQDDEDDNGRSNNPNNAGHYEKLHTHSDGTPVYHYIPSDKHKAEEQKLYSDVKASFKLVDSELDKFRSGKVKSAKDKASRLKAMQTPRRLFDTSFTMFDYPSFNDNGSTTRRLDVTIEDCEANDGICATGVTAINTATAGIDIILDEINTILDITDRVKQTFDLFRAMHLVASGLELAFKAAAKIPYIGSFFAFCEKVMKVSKDALKNLKDGAKQVENEIIEPFIEPPLGKELEIW